MPKTIMLTDQAMEMILTGVPVVAPEMERFGLVNRVCTADQSVVEEACKVANVVAAFSQPAVGLAKQAVKAGEQQHDP